MEKNIKVVVTHGFFYGFGATLSEAIKRYTKASKKRFNKDVNVYVFRGDVENITIDEMGIISAPTGITQIRIQ